MSDQQANSENNIQSFDQPGSAGGGWKKPVLIGLIVVVLLTTVGILVWTFWLKGLSQAPSILPGEPSQENNNSGSSNGTSETPATNTPSQVSPTAPVNIQSIPVGINRPVTKQERIKYNFSLTDDIWVKTTSPTDGSVPQMSFYNKTVNPSPVPYVNPPPGKK
jgi:hypothetical protein